MPALKPTDFTATVTWLGRVADREAALASTPLPEMALTFAGLAGEAHAGLTRPSCARVLSQHPRDTEIRNVRQLSIVSEEDLEEIAAAIGLPRVEPAWLGASVAVRGLPGFTLIPPSSRLQNAAGTTLVVDMENRPCHLPAKVIEDLHPGHGKAFKDAARNKRGVTAWVEREGPLRVGDVLRLHIPDQPAWPHLAAARA